MDKGQIFRALHAGSRRLRHPQSVGHRHRQAARKSLGFKALATTSAGFAFSRGLPDGGVGFEAMIHHCREMAAAVDLPVSADLEKGKGDSPQSAGETMFAAEAAGLAGCSIEDHTGDPREPIYDFAQAVERVAAAADAARAVKRGLRADGAGGELPVGPARPRRHDPPPAGVRAGRRRRALRARADHAGRGASDLRRRLQAGQRAGNAGLHRRRAGRGRRQPHLAGLQARHLRLRHAGEGGGGDARPGHLRLRPRRERRSPTCRRCSPRPGRRIRDRRSPSSTCIRAASRCASSPAAIRRCRATRSSTSAPMPATISIICAGC